MNNNTLLQNHDQTNPSEEPTESWSFKNITFFGHWDQADLPKQLPHFGVVYLLEFNNGLIKIGCSSQPAKRIRDLEPTLRQYGQLEITHLAISRECTNYQSVEQQLHQRFKLFNVY